MRDIVFEVTDKTERKIRLTKDRWKHIRTEHPEITDEEEIKRALVLPNKIISSDRDESVRWYFIYKKDIKRYFKVPVKYLNGEGYVITAHHTTKIA